MLAEVTWREATQAQSPAELDAILDEIAGKISSDLPQAVFVARSQARWRGGFPQTVRKSCLPGSAPFYARPELTGMLL